MDTKTTALTLALAGALTTALAHVSLFRPEADR
jgi:hypothetical protein